jgi:hypothetical protein
MSSFILAKPCKGISGAWIIQTYAPQNISCNLFNHHACSYIYDHCEMAMSASKAKPSAVLTSETLFFSNFSVILVSW